MFLSEMLRQTRYCKLLLTSMQELDISINNEVIFQPFTIKISELAPHESAHLVSKVNRKKKKKIEKNKKK